MKKFALVLALAFSVHSYAQNTDSLLELYNSAAHDTTKVNALLLLSDAASSHDSSLYWARLALTLAKKEGFKTGEARSYGKIAAIFMETDNFPKALDYYFKSQAIYQRINNLDELRKGYIAIGRIYRLEGNYATALSYFKKAVEILRQLGQDERLAYFPIGSAFDDMKQNDSAFYYYQRAYEYSSTKGNKSSLASVLSHLGALHLRIKNYELALTYGRMSVAAYEQYSSHMSLSTYIHFAETLDALGKRDSALFYARKAFETGVNMNRLHLQLEGASMLARIHPDDRQARSFYKIATDLRDSLYNNDKSAEIQNLSFNERQRQAEIEENIAREKTERRQNLQYAAIAIGLFAFLLAYLLLSHSIIARERFVRFLGVLSLLVVFEFVNLLIHPYLSEFTHHSPLWMLLIMVAIAALLIPLHHKLEKWVTHKLVEKNKKIRIAAAKKTLAKLEGNTEFLQSKESIDH